MTYFSETENGEIPQENEEIGEGAWGGIRVLINARIDDGSFGTKYPTPCEDGGAITGSDRDAVWTAMRADIPNLLGSPPCTTQSRRKPCISST